MIKNKKAFTLVELIVVITILAILATIGFISLQGYSMDARNSTRLTDAKVVEKSLELSLLKNGVVPIPDQDRIEIISSGTLIGYQGYFGADAFKSTTITDAPIDPLDKTYFTYATNSQLTNYQIAVFLENAGQANLGLNKVSALQTDYTNRKIKVFGKKVGLLLFNIGADINRPLQESYNISSFSGIDIKTFTGILSNGQNVGELKAVISDTESIIGTGEQLSRLENIYNGVVQIAMTASLTSSTCPSGWKEVGYLNDGGGRSQTLYYLGNVFGRVCEGPMSAVIPKGAVVMMTQCPSGWNNIGYFNAGGRPLVTLPLYNTAGLACQAIDDTTIDSGAIVGMTSCPNGYTQVGYAQTGGREPIPFYFGSEIGKACQKN